MSAGLLRIKCKYRSFSVCADVGFTSIVISASAASRTLALTVSMTPARVVGRARLGVPRTVNQSGRQSETRGT